MSFPSLDKANIKDQAEVRKAAFDKLCRNVERRNAEEKARKLRFAKEMRLVTRQGGIDRLKNPITSEKALEKWEAKNE